MAIMVFVFAAVYAVTVAREGFAYKGAILIPDQENDNMIYSGKVRGEQAAFIVYADKTVEFRYGDKTYGPYTAKEDPTAIPKDSGMSGSMTGVELSRGKDILFRGGVLDSGSRRWLYNEDGSVDISEFSVTASNGIVTDEKGNEIDPMEPSAATILDLMAGPELTHKGEWLAWFGGVFVCIAAAISILFAEELFRWSLAFRIRDADRAEPSDWIIMGRYITWTFLPIAAMILFLVGLQ